MSGFKLQRLGMIMEPEPGSPHEVEGVLNPGVARGPDGELYLFPRLVAKGNYSRKGLRACGSMKAAIQRAWRGLASHWNRKPIMKGDPTAAVAARTLASRSLSRSNATS